jgi:hypothetical protein
VRDLGAPKGPPGSSTARSGFAGLRCPRGTVAGGVGGFFPSFFLLFGAPEFAKPAPELGGYLYQRCPSAVTTRRAPFSESAPRFAPPIKPLIAAIAVLRSLHRSGFAKSLSSLSQLHSQGPALIAGAGRAHHSRIVQCVKPRHRCAAPRSKNEAAAAYAPLLQHLASTSTDHSRRLTPTHADAADAAVTNG